MQREERGRDISTYQCSNKITTKKLSTHTQKRVPLPLAVLFFVSCVHPCLPPSQQFYFSEPSVPRCVSGPSSPDPKKQAKMLKQAMLNPSSSFFIGYYSCFQKKIAAYSCKSNRAKKTPPAKAGVAKPYSQTATQAEKHMSNAIDVYLTGLGNQRHFKNKRIFSCGAKQGNKKNLLKK